MVVGKFPNDKWNQGKNRDFEDNRDETIEFVQFCTTVAGYQVMTGRLFLVHPLFAMSCSLNDLDRLRRNESVDDVVVRVPEPIRILSSMPSILSSLFRSLIHTSDCVGWSRTDQNGAGGFFSTKGGFKMIPVDFEIESRVCMWRILVKC